MFWYVWKNVENYEMHAFDGFYQNKDFAKFQQDMNVWKNAEKWS